MSVPPIGTGAIGLPVGTAAKTPEERAALGFERMLLERLTEQLAKAVEPEDEAASAATGAYRDMLPGALADALIAGGGIGLAQSLTRDAT